MTWDYRAQRKLLLDYLASGDSAQNVTTTGDVSAADITATGDLAAAGGYRSLVGPFILANVPASQTDTRLGVGASGAPQQDIVMPRAGSVMGITASFTVDPAGSDLVLEVYKNGALLNAACILTVAAAGTDLDQYAVFAKDTYTFAAGDRIGLALTTDVSWTAITSGLCAMVEIEC